MIRRTLAGAGAAACVLGLAVAAPATAQATGADDTTSSRSYQAALDPVTANGVTGTGASWITVTGTTAEVKIQVNGLLDGVPHAQHIHVGAAGRCPTEPALHNGRPSITVTDGAPLYGGIATSLTVDGPTSAEHGLDVTHFPQTGSYTYSRTVELDAGVVDALAGGTAVLVVHGVDVNGNGIYDDVLGASDLDPALPAEATDPALCGAYRPMQMAAVPDGAADTGGGSTAGGTFATGVPAGPAGGMIVVALAGGAPAAVAAGRLVRATRARG